MVSLTTPQEAQLTATTTPVLYLNQYLLLRHSQLHHLVSEITIPPSNAPVTSRWPRWYKPKAFNFAIGRLTSDSNHCQDLWAPK